MTTTIRRFTAALVAAFAGVAHAQQWVQLTDPLSVEKPPPIWCNAQRTACAISWQANGPAGAVRVALTATGEPDCEQRRPRYVMVRNDGRRDGDVRAVHAMKGRVCFIDIPMEQIERTQRLRFSLPMLTQDYEVAELPLDGFNVDRLPKNRS